MKVLFLKQAHKDMRWWRRYYRATFPAGQMNAAKHLDKIIRLLADNPEAGQKIEGTGLRSIPISRTPFIIVYRYTPDLIEIAHVWDGRQQSKPGPQERYE